MVCPVGSFVSRTLAISGVNFPRFLLLALLAPLFPATVVHHGIFFVLVLVRELIVGLLFLSPPSHTAAKYQKQDGKQNSYAAYHTPDDGGDVGGGTA
jgi:hypothetical protein